LGAGDHPGEDAGHASRSLRSFQVRLQREFSEAQSLFVPELSPRGRIHFHGLIFNVPLCLGDTRQGRLVVSHGDERKTRILARLWREGYVDARKTDGSRKLAYYICKYITKGAGETLFNAMHLQRISQGFPREIIIRGKLAEELQHRYDAGQMPVSEWKGKNLFLGEMHRKIYDANTP
jgi:hypothetical protein